MNNIIFVEGIPGCGKSTTSQYIYEQLKKNNINTNWLHEGIIEHPFYVRNDFFNENGVIDADKFDEYLDFFISIFSNIKKEIKTSNKVYVIDGLLLTGFMNVYFNSDCSTERITHYFRKLEEFLLPLNPLLIYLETERVKEHTLETWMGRALWGTDRVIKSYAKTPRVKRSGVEGENILYEYIEPIQNQNLIHFDLTTFDKMKFVVDSKEYQKYQNEILNHLGIEQDLQMNEAFDRERYIGIYDNDGYKEKMVIKIHNDELVCDWGQLNMVLNYVEPNVFNLRSYPIFLRFDEKNDEIVGFETYGEQCYERAGWFFHKVDQSKY